MNVQTIIRENWYSRKPDGSALFATSIFSAVLFAASFAFLFGFFKTTSWMPASASTVFDQHQVWRLWTTLFAHGDLGHLLNNSLLFLPLTYLLTSYFGLYLFPVLGLILGGLVNFIVLKTLPLETSLIGMSGVVYYLGASWLTLFVLIDSRKSLKRRFAIALFLTVMLFAPQTYTPQISYLSHLLGYALGIVTAGIYYLVYRQKILSAEVREYLIEDPEVVRFEQDVVQHQEPEISKAQY